MKKENITGRPEPEETYKTFKQGRDLPDIETPQQKEETLKKIEERFDKKFRCDCSPTCNYLDTDIEKVKQFYHQEIQNLLTELKGGLERLRTRYERAGFDDVYYVEKSEVLKILEEFNN